MSTSVAVVPIERPARYAKQLASHIGHRVDVTDRPGGYDVAFTGGTGIIEVGEDRLTLTATSEDAEVLTRIKDVLGRHLLQFTTRLPDVAVTWIDS